MLGCTFGSFLLFHYVSRLYCTDTAFLMFFAKIRSYVKFPWKTKIDRWKKRLLHSSIMMTSTLHKFFMGSWENHRGCNNWWPIFPSIESERAHASWCKKKGSRVTDVHLARLRLLSEYGRSRCSRPQHLSSGAVLSSSHVEGHTDGQYLLRLLLCSLVELPHQPKYRVFNVEIHSTAMSKCMQWKPC